ncbi:hypothetical protein BH11ACT4_BH11ACT4_23680 [soil metagenome]
MLETLIHSIGSPLTRLWLKMSPQSWRTMPTPPDKLAAHSPGPNSDQVLLVGSGIAVGYGVRSANLALGGYLARQIAAFTGRGASVETIATLTMRMSRCISALEPVDASRFDAIVITLGTDEALSLMPARRFRREVDRLLDWLDDHAPTSMTVLFVGIPQVPAILKLPWPLARLVGRQCTRLDEQLRLACAEHPRAAYTPFATEPSDLLQDSDRHTYARWAERIAPGVARVLDTQLADPREPSGIDEEARQSALDDLDILDTKPEERFDRLVAFARDLFGVGGASITFIDRDRQWTKASTGVDPTDSPRGSALCDATVHNGKIFVVDDASLDPRFAGHPWVTGRTRVRFFAGFPIEAANGQRIGALCVFDPTPRTFSNDESALLGKLARQVQTDLWGAGAVAR